MKPINILQKLNESDSKRLNESTLEDIDYNLRDGAGLDTEWSEALAKVEVDLGILPDTPLNMCYRNGQEDLYNKIVNKQLNKQQMTKIYTEISKIMKNDFQYSKFANTFSRYIDDSIGDVSFDNIKPQERKPAVRTSTRQPVIDAFNDSLSKYGCNLSDYPSSLGYSTSFLKDGSERGIRVSLNTRRVSDDEVAISFNRTTAKKYGDVQAALSQYEVSNYSTPSSSGDYIFAVYKRKDIPKISEIISNILKTK